MNKILQKVSEREVGCEFPTNNLEILNFYGTEAGFIWNEDKLLIFPYHPDSTSDEEVQIIDSGPLKSHKLTAPKPIKTICSYSGRVFIVCEPTGIYKLSDKYKFVVLSTTGIGLGCEVHQVLTPTRGWLYLADKITKKSKHLFQLSENVNYRDYDGVIVYDLRQILFCASGDDDNKSCLITSGKKLYKLIDERVTIIHVESNFITDILAVKRDQRDFGVGLITEGNYLVLLLPDEDTRKLMPLRKLCYDGDIVALTIYFPRASTDQLWCFHTNGHNIYHRRVCIDCSGLDRNENVEVVFTSNERIINCLRPRGDGILMLSDGQLTEFEIMKMGRDGEKREFNTLKEDMIRNTNIIVDKICERAKELELVNKGIAVAQGRLERISAYAHKQKTQYSPAVRILRVGGRQYLEVKLEGLPLDSQVFVNVVIESQRLFASKVVCDRVTTLEVPLEIGNLGEVEKFDVRIDLVAAQCETQLWCILNNYGVDSSKVLGGEGSCRAATDRENLLTAKLSTLRSLMEKKSVDDVKLRYIKKSIRKEMRD
ncbi:uncharacterized protein LOC107040671 [Diachasma alloeum]|uniref:uncharacterized protein LOC107040671 n=1 Tax=Diachasma alloeum TaxID=454923 RepID=UPI0007382FB1|nr:uncharacterized protein LOC107040671 [Diachasma alloeum]